jgi:hypothetical protein
LLLCLPLLSLALATSLAQACSGGAKAVFSTKPLSRGDRIKARVITAYLHLIQPLARLSGRLRHGLRPWRRRGTARFSAPWPRCSTRWDEQWQAADRRLAAIEGALAASGAVVSRGGPFVRWDLEVRGGLMGRWRGLMTIEEHGAGRQLVRWRCWPVAAAPGLGAILVSLGLALGASLDGAWPAAIVLGVVALTMIGQLFLDCAAAAAAWDEAVKVRPAD